VAIGRVNRPGFKFWGLKGIAIGQMSLSSGNLTARFGGTLDLPAPLAWFKLGGGVELALNYNTSGFSLQCAGRLTWGSTAQLVVILQTGANLDNPSAKWAMAVGAHLPTRPHNELYIGKGSAGVQKW
jgi:hypothetical protein